MEKSSLNKFISKKRQPTAVLTECKICGDSAIYSYYGAVSCSSCKTFFKRHAQQGQQAFKCDLNGNCEINLNTRRACTYCRLHKCFTNGMQVEMIRGPFSKRNKTRKPNNIVNSIQTTTTTVVARLNQPEQFPTLNLLQSDQSTLTIDQWILLSNLSHCYDEYNGLLIGKNFMDQQNNLPLKFRFKSAPMIDFFHMELDQAQLLYKNNRDFLHLYADDRSILLQKTFKYTSSISLHFIYQQIGLCNYPAFYDTVELITNSGVASDTKRIQSLLNFDIIITKLFLAILSFSTISYTTYSNNSSINFSNIKQIINLQDTYIELTCKYLFYKYKYEQVIKCFSQFIRCIFAVNDALVKIDDVQWFTDEIDFLIEQIK
ncbi:unnamed protein product [Rotaria sp. Silwood2]|nr:unnamed protein product [Rotaria sp. Silwood2]